MENSALPQGTITRNELRRAWKDMWQEIHKITLGLAYLLNVDQEILRAEWTNYGIYVEVVSKPDGFFLEVRMDQVVYLYNPARQTWIKGRQENNTFVPTEVQGVIYQYDSSVVVSDAYARLRGG